MVSEKKNTKPVYGFFFKNVVCTLGFFFFWKEKKNHIWPCGFPFWIQGGEPPLTRKHQKNNLVCWKVLCKINKNRKEGFELKTLSSRAKAHPNKPHALL